MNLLLIMGNTPSSEEGFDKDKFIEEQKKIILEQNEQIQKLANITEANTAIPDNGEPINHKRSKKSQKPKINPYLELRIGQTYDESSLKKAYLSRALETHPDRGGTQEEFQRVTVSYKALMIKLRNESNSHEHNELRDNSSGFREQQVSDNYQNREYKDMSQNFDSNVFNQIYEENRMDDVHDQGYEKWMKENESSTEDIIHNTSLTKDNFNNEFSKHKHKQMRKQGTELKKYSEPMEDISYKNKSSIMVLGREKVDDFSGESGGLSFRDYKDAYTNTFLVSGETVDPRRPKDLKGTQRERENVSYEMTEKDMEIYALKKIKEEKEEELRIQRLSERDQTAATMYDRVHQRMLGQ
jgi:curved DNA-binding protein CbpA